ncbi:TPA: GNAT family N-acetyltransferase [Providencia alcalifaciens]|nr:GNAT family N-acetyltransferase [Providencia alcalifaciens]
MKIKIKPYQPQNAEKLHEIFYTSVHRIAAEYYTEEQLEAWAPNSYEREQWQNKMDALKPFIAYIDEEIVGYADLQDNGYIDHFFVTKPRCGIGSALMNKILEVANIKGINKLWSHVSLSAEEFFKSHQFEIVERREVFVKGVVLHNAMMVRENV